MLTLHNLLNFIVNSNRSRHLQWFLVAGSLKFAHTVTIKVTYGLSVSGITPRNIEKHFNFPIIRSTWMRILAILLVTVETAPFFIIGGASNLSFTKGKQILNIESFVTHHHNLWLQLVQEATLSCNFLITDATVLQIGYIVYVNKRRDGSGT